MPRHPLATPVPPLRKHGIAMMNAVMPNRPHHRVVVWDIGMKDMLAVVVTYNPMSMRGRRRSRWRSSTWTQFFFQA